MNNIPGQPAPTRADHAETLYISKEKVTLLDIMKRPFVGQTCFKDRANSNFGFQLGVIKGITNSLAVPIVAAARAIATLAGRDTSKWDIAGIDTTKVKAEDWGAFALALAMGPPLTMTAAALVPLAIGMTIVEGAFSVKIGGSKFIQDILPKPQSEFDEDLGI